MLTPHRFWTVAGNFCMWKVTKLDSCNWQVAIRHNVRSQPTSVILPACRHSMPQENKVSSLKPPNHRKLCGRATKEAFVGAMLHSKGLVTRAHVGGVKPGFVGTGGVVHTPMFGCRWAYGCRRHPPGGLRLLCWFTDAFGRLHQSSSFQYFTAQLRNFEFKSDEVADAAGLGPAALREHEMSVDRSRCPLPVALGAPGFHFRGGAGTPRPPENGGGGGLGKGLIDRTINQLF